jgi:hypothetical protein
MFKRWVKLWRETASDEGYSDIKQDGYLGPFHTKLQVGDTQVLLFHLQDSEPFWMTAEE